MESVATSNPPGEPYTVAEPRYAGFWIRVGANLIDQLILMVVCIVLALLVLIPTFILVEMLGRTLESGVFADILGFAVTYPVIWLYMTIFESSAWQATPGKRALGLRVTDLDGQRISFARANGRYFAKMISTLLCFFGYLQIGVHSRKQGLHDQIAETLVIHRASA